MLMVRSSSRPRRATFRSQAATVEGMEGRVLLAGVLAATRNQRPPEQQRPLTRASCGADARWDPPRRSVPQSTGVVTNGYDGARPSEGMGPQEKELPEEQWQPSEKFAPFAVGCWRSRLWRAR
jgi:hypothetical protein